jgi:ligand-binding sensor domain-containing protein
MRALLLVLLISCGGGFLFGQDFTYTIRNYKAVDGLPQSQVNIVLEDKNGYLWIGTQGGGLARFDGREFIVYTTLDGLLSNIISFLKLDENENLWIVHPRGITKYDGVSFKKFRQPGSPLNARRMRKIFELNDTIFFTSGQGEMGKIYSDSVYYWTKKVKSGQYVRYSHVDRDKNIFHYMSDSSFFVRTSKSDFTIDHKKSFNRLLGMFNYRNKVWLKTDSGYFTINLDTKTFEPNSLVINNHIVFYDTLNDLFWTRYQNTLLKEKIEANKVKVDTVLRDIEVTQVLVDSEGNTWFASAGTGLFKYFIQDFDRCSSENLKGVSSILKDKDGSSWIGSSSRGLWRIKKGKISSYVYKNDPYRNMVNCIRQSPDGTIWVGTGYGLGKYDLKSDKFEWFTRDHGLSNASVVAIDFDDAGNLWIGTFSGGVNFYDGKTFRVYTVKGIRTRLTR